ncbi:MAG: DNA topoisomerase, partial [Gemmatimonadota bacterium]
TYMRTDSTRVSGAAAGRARGYLESRFGSAYVPRAARRWAGKQQKSAQEAHEAIRPTDPARAPDAVRPHLDRDGQRLYELIWRRFMAGQMAAALFDTTTLDFDLDGGGRRYLFRATGSVLAFDGFTRVYRPTRDRGQRRGDGPDSQPLPPMEPGEFADLEELEPAQHFTKPPPRFSEASLVKELEKRGIGRPSTYAQILTTLRSRKYVVMEKRRFVPTPLGETVARVLVRIFPDLFDPGFTSGMEEELDRIEDGGRPWQAVLEDFYGPFQRQLEAGRRDGDAIIRSLLSLSDERCPECGEPLFVRWTRRGRFIGCGGYPECRYTRSMDGETRPEPTPTGESCPECGGDLVRRIGRYGPFVGCDRHPACSFTRPATVPGLRCPRCGTGRVGEKRTRKGKPFWGCTRYPECDWSVWDRPVPIACTTCGEGVLVEKRSKRRGAYYRCLGCKAEMKPAAVEAEAGVEE